MVVEHVVDAEIVVDGNGNRVSSYSGSNTSCFQFDTKRVLELFNHKTPVYLKNPLGFSNVVYISGIKASMHDGRIIIDMIEFEYYRRTETKSVDIDRPFYPIDFISKPYKWTLYVEEGTFDEKEGHPLHASFEFDGSKYPKIFTERLIDLSKQPYIEVNGILHNWHPDLGDTFKHIYDSLFDMAFNTGLPVITGHQKPISEETDQEWFIPINESSNLMDKTRLTIGNIYELRWDEGMWIVQLTNLSDLMFTCMCCDKTSPDYGKEPTLSISYCQNHGVIMRNRHCSKHNESIGRSFTTYSQKEDMKMPEDNVIKRRDPETAKGIRPATRYEFDPEYFYKLCAFTVIDLRTDPVTRYECILIETNPTHLVFAAFDGEKDYSGRQEFKNIKRLTVNMDRYLAGEFQLIRHAWECAE